MVWGAVTAAGTLGHHISNDDLKRGVAKSFFAYLANEQTVAARMRKARRALDAGTTPPGE